MNIQRACEASLDIGQHIIRQNSLGIVQSSRDVFDRLENRNVISADLARRMQKAIGFRNVAVHDYQTLLMPIVTAILSKDIDDFLEFARAIMASADALMR